MPLVEEAHKAARTLLDHAYVRIVARGEPDAVSAAALLSHALRRENVDFHVSFARRLDEAHLKALADERPDCLVLVGLSGDSAAREPTAGRRLVIDANEPTIQGDAVVHADAALASMAHLVAAGISRRNVDLAPLAIVGSLASWRHVGGLKGLDAEILNEALDARLMLREAALQLPGNTLLAALSQLDAPFVAGLTGRARNAKKLIADMSLADDAPPATVPPDAQEKLGSFLALRLLQQNAPDAALDALFRPAMRGLQGPHTGLECGALARLAEAACAAERPGLAFAALWPDPTVAGEAADLLTPFREEIVAGLLRAERDARREGKLMIVEATRAALCQPLADRLAASLAPPDALTVVHAADEDGAYVALRSWSLDAGAAAKRIGGTGTAREAHAWVPDAARALKALSEVGA